MANSIFIQISVKSKNITGLNVQVIDQIAGAIARFIMTESALVPVNDIVPVLMNNLPLKSDETEYDYVFKALGKLYSAGELLLNFKTNALFH